MAKDYDYDFSELSGDEEKPESPEIVRPNFKVSRCCGNCKYFWYYKGNQRRGSCKLPDPQAKKINKKEGERYYDKKTRKEWDKTHITNVCDLHQFRSFQKSIKMVGEYCGVKFDTNGELRDQED